MTFELFNCDCLEAYADIDFSNVVIVSDPPFNIGYHYSAYADTLPEAEYMEWLVNVFKPAPHVLIHYPEKSAHPCQMPLEVMDRIVKILPPEKTILDPFMGSGTTGLAALRNGRRFIGMELDERYFEIAKERLQNLRK